MKTLQALEQNTLSNKWEMARTIEELDEVEQRYLGTFRDYVRPIPYKNPGEGLQYSDEKGYMTFKINPRAPHEIIFERLRVFFGLADPPEKRNRFRKEAFKALEVYKKWKDAKKLSLSLVAKGMKIPYATAKTRWRRAYELIYGKKYDPREVRRENKGKADKLCAECEIPNCYKEKDSRLEQIPCAAYLRLAGKGYQREKSMSEKHFMLIPSGETENSIEG